MTTVTTDREMQLQLRWLINATSEEISMKQIKNLDSLFTGSIFRHTFSRELTEYLRSSNQEKKLNKIIALFIIQEIDESQNFNMLLRANTLAPCLLMFYLSEEFYAEVAAIIDRSSRKPKEMLYEISLTLARNACNKHFRFIFSLLREIKNEHDNIPKNTTNYGLELVSRIFLFSILQTGLYHYYYANGIPREKAKYLADMLSSHYLVTHIASYIRGETSVKQPISMQTNYNTIDLSSPQKKRVKPELFQKNLTDNIQRLEKIPVNITALILDRNLFDNFKFHHDKAKLFDKIRDLFFLESLSLTDCELGRDAFLLFPTGDDKKDKFLALKKLHVGGNILGGQNLNIIPQLLSNSLPLDYLDLNGNLVNDNDINNCSSYLAKNSHLKKLDLGNNAITVKGARQIAEALKTNSELRSLSISGNDIGNEGALALLNALNNNPHSRLTELNLSETRINYEGIIKICDLLMNNKTISHINIGGGLTTGCERTIVTAKIAELLGTNKQIKYLGLARRCLTDSIISAILQNARPVALTGIDLSDNWLSDTALVSLIEIFRDTPVISKLILNENKNIANTESNLAYLAYLVGKTQKLSIRMTGIAAATSILIDGIRQSKALESIDLSDNNIDDQGALKTAVEQCKTLAFINLNNCGLGDNALNDIDSIIRKRQITYNVAEKELILEDDLLPADTVQLNYNLPEWQDFGSSKKQVDKTETKISRKGLSSISVSELEALLKLPETSTIGTAVDDGGCFFDALAQALNAIENGDIHSEKSLREACQRFYLDHKTEVDRWNKNDYAGLDQGTDYHFVQYTKQELDTHFNQRPPIWGRPEIEGRILCEQLSITAICIIELMDNPDDNSKPIINQLFIGNKGYKQSASSHLENIPTLIVGQKGLHFVPVLPKKKVLELHNYPLKIQKGQDSLGQNFSEDISVIVPKTFNSLRGKSEKSSQSLLVESLEGTTIPDKASVEKSDNNVRIETSIQNRNRFFYSGATSSSSSSSADAKSLSSNSQERPWKKMLGKK